MKHAVIDLGTNSVLLLIGEIRKPGKIHILHQRYAITRLGDKVFETGELNPPAMKRTLSILRAFARDIESYQARNVHLLGTAALRRAANADRFIDRVHQQLGWKLQIISGEEEARYSYLGALEAADASNHTLVIMDVGGGSTEIIRGRGQRMDSFVSLPLGVVELAERFNMKQHLSQRDQTRLRSLIRMKLKRVNFLQDLETSGVLIGVGGTISTLAAVKENMQRYDPEKINGYKLREPELAEIFDALNRLTLTQRRRLPAMLPGREDVILYGILIYLEMMAYAGFDAVVASDRGLRFGYLKYVEGIKESRKGTLALWHSGT